MDTIENSSAFVLTNDELPTVIWIPPVKCYRVCSPTPEETSVSLKTVQVGQDPDRPKGIATIVVWDAFSSLQPKGPTSVVPSWWTGTKCQTFFTNYKKHTEDKQIGGLFQPGDPSADDQHGKPTPVVQAVASETEHALQARQDAAQARRLQNYFDQAARAQAVESDEDSYNDGPVTSPPLPDPSVFIRPTAA